MRSIGSVKSKAPSATNFFSADVLNDHFSAIVNRHRPLRSEDLAELLALPLTQPYERQFRFRRVTMVDITTALQKSLSASCGHDGITLPMLKQCIGTLGPYILELVNRSLESGAYPTSWKFALINPLSKTSHPASPNDARPVALLTELSKLCERVVQQQLMQFIQAENLLSPCQSCYKKGDSTQTALLGVLEDIRWAIERRMVTILALFDFSKAFDCIPHRALLSKLQGLGILGTPLTWFYNYLQGRYQAVG